MTRILGIETTCDETSFAVVEDATKVLYETTISQAKKHSKYGGVVPELAAREHIKNIMFMLPDLVDQLKAYKPDYVAVASDVGLPPAVKTGEAFAYGVASALGVDVLRVNHVVAHIWGVWLEPEFQSKPEAPFLGMILSGGHSQILLFKTLREYEILADTLDDAVGEVFDKIARHMGLGYPGGPLIEQYARQGDEFAIPLPRPLSGAKHKETLAFSFAGLKTAVIKEHDRLSSSTFEEYKEFLKYDIAASFQRTAFEHVAEIVQRVLNKYPEYSSFVLGGGVVANQRLLDILGQRLTPQGVKIYAPRKYTGDNAALIAGYAFNLL